MTERHALRAARRPARVQHQGHVIVQQRRFLPLPLAGEGRGGGHSQLPLVGDLRVEKAGVRRKPLTRRRAVIGRQHEKLGTDVLQVITKFSFRVAGIQGAGGGQGRGREEEDDRLGPVGKGHRDTHAGLDAGGGKPFGRFIDELAETPIREGGTAGDAERDIFGAASGEQRSQIRHAQTSLSVTQARRMAAQRTPIRFGRHGCSE